MSNVSLALAVPSVAVTRIDRVPASPLCGLPENRRRPGVNVSHLGSRERAPFISTAMAA